MVKLADCAAHHLHDLRMAVAEDGAHLAGAELESAQPPGLPPEPPTGALRDKRCKSAAVANQMGPRLLPERRVGIGLAKFSIVHAALLGPNSPRKRRDTAPGTRDPTVI